MATRTRKPQPARHANLAVVDTEKDRFTFGSDTLTIVSRYKGSEALFPHVKNGTRIRMVDRAGNGPQNGDIGTVQERERTLTPKYYVHARWEQYVGGTWYVEPDQTVEILTEPAPTRTATHGALADGIAKSLKIGDRVRLVSNSRDGGPKIGDVGTVLELAPESQHIGVRWDQYTKDGKGHSLNGTHGFDRGGWNIEHGQVIELVIDVPLAVVEPKDLEGLPVVRPKTTEPLFTETITLPSARREVTAVELLKSYSGVLEQVPLPGLLRRLQLDKNYDLGALRRLANNGIFGQAMENLLLRTHRVDREGVFNYFGRALSTTEPEKLTPYVGSRHQIARILRARQSGQQGAIVNPPATPVYYGNGMATYFKVEGGRASDRLFQVPIAVIGYGAAGILMALALRHAGFTQVTIIEQKRERRLGIWGRANVYNRTRNNPRPLQFQGQRLQAAPGGGREVKDFLTPIMYELDASVNVKRIEPGRLKHTVIGDDISGREYRREFPIVVNCMGLGKPAPLSDPTRMQTTAKASDAGPRWQAELDAEQARGHRFVFIGLGNSTAEMLRQVHTLLDDGVELDYRVLTHYPEDSVWNPDTNVSLLASGNKTWRVFRDVSQPNLVDFQGDLSESRFDYYRALTTGKILHDVTQWDVKDGVMRVRAQDKIEEFKYSQIYTLTGYKHTQESLAPFGIKCENDTPIVDYDGEFRDTPGYFGFGSIVETPWNLNATVIPGMIGSIGDTLFSVVMRAAEVART
jgi:hypothetical protein